MTERKERTMEALMEIIQAFVIRERGPLREPLTPDTRLLQRGLLESVQLARLSGEIARTLEITIPRGTLVLQDFDTPRSLWRSLERLQ